jgi:hypothetical protein
MKIKVITETINTTQDVMPEKYQQEGWQYDGRDFCVGTGECSYFWTRDTGRIEEITYTLSEQKIPKGDNWKFTHIRHCKKQKRYMWSREMKKTKNRRSNRNKKIV